MKSSCHSTHNLMVLQLFVETSTDLQVQVRRYEANFIWMKNYSLFATEALSASMQDFSHTRDLTEMYSLNFTGIIFVLCYENSSSNDNGKYSLSCKTQNFFPIERRGADKHVHVCSSDLCTFDIQNEFGSCTQVVYEKSDLFIFWLQNRSHSYKYIFCFVQYQQLVASY